MCLAADETQLRPVRSKERKSTEKTNPVLSSKYKMLNITEIVHKILKRSFVLEIHKFYKYLCILNSDRFRKHGNVLEYF